MYRRSNSELHANCRLVDLVQQLLLRMQMVENALQIQLDEQVLERANPEDLPLRTVEQVSKFFDQEDPLYAQRFARLKAKVTRYLTNAVPTKDFAHKLVSLVMTDECAAAFKTHSRK